MKLTKKLFKLLDDARHPHMGKLFLIGSADGEIYSERVVFDYPSDCQIIPAVTAQDIGRAATRLWAKGYTHLMFACVPCTTRILMHPGETGRLFMCDYAQRHAPKENVVTIYPEEALQEKNWELLKIEVI